MQIYKQTIAIEPENINVLKRVEVPGRNPRISFDGKYWYLSVGVEQAQQPIELTDETIDIDMGIKDLYKLNLRTPKSQFET